MQDQNLVPFPNAWTRDGGWFFSTGSGYYIHRNRLYLQGEATNFDPSSSPRTFRPVLPTILGGLPLELRPAEVTVEMAVSVPDPATPGVVPVDIITATIGDAFVLDSMPPFVNKPPSDPQLVNVGEPANVPWFDAGFVPPTSKFVSPPNPDFPTPLEYTIVIGNVSWQLAGVVEDIDWARESLGPYLADNWQNIDATIGMHGSRVHLSGRVKATKNASPITGADGQSRFTISGGLIPAKYVAALTNGAKCSIAAPRVAGLLELLVDGNLGGGTLQLPNDVAGGLLPAGPTIDSWDAPRDTPTTWEPTGWTPGFSPYLGYPLVDQFGRSMIGGLQTHPRGAYEVAEDAIDWAGGRATAPHFSMPSPGSEETYGYVYTNKNEIRLGPLPGFSSDEVSTVDAYVHDTLGVLYPKPDWVGLFVSWAGQPFDFSSAFSSKISADKACDIVAADTGLPFPGGTFSNGANGLPNGNGGYGGGNAAVANPSGSEYTGDPNNPCTVLLWKPDDIPDHWTVTAEWHAGVSISYFFIEFDVDITLLPIPFWNARRDYVLAGDVIDLAGCGWQAAGAAPGPGEATVGQGQQGIRPRGWRKGRLLG